MASVAGLTDLRGVTFRELEARWYGVRKHDWGIAAQAMAVAANLQRGSDDAPFAEPWQFMPADLCPRKLPCRDTTKGTPIDADMLRVLARCLCKKSDG